MQTLVSVLNVEHVGLLAATHEASNYCTILHSFLCPCLGGRMGTENMAAATADIQAAIAAAVDAAPASDNFTVVLQPFLLNATLPLTVPSLLSLGRRLIWS